MALYKLEACRKSRWFLKPHATAISGHKILNGNMQSAQKCLHPKNTQTHSQSMQAHGQYLRHLFPLPTFLSLKHQFQVLGQFFTCPPKKKLSNIFLCCEKLVMHFLLPKHVCVCMWEDTKRQEGECCLWVCVHAMLESRVPASRVFHVICSQASFLSLSISLPLHKLPFHVTCRCHIRSPFIFSREFWVLCASLSLFSLQLALFLCRYKNSDSRLQQT